MNTIDGGLKIMNEMQKQKLMKMQLGKRQKSYPTKKSNPNKYILKLRFLKEINEIMESWEYHDIEDAISYILNTKNKNFVFLKETLFPNSYENLFQGRFMKLKNQNLERILCWYAIIISSCFEKINLFVELKSKYENLLISGDYEYAEIILDEIDNRIGFSIWGLDNRFIVNEYKGGLEGNKEYLAKINILNCHSWIECLADFFSFKAEKGVNNRQYIHRIEKVMERTSNQISPFFVEKLFPLYSLEIDDIYNMLYCNSKASIIDMYNAYVKASVRIIVDDEVDKINYNAVTKSLSLLENIEDITVQKLKMTNMALVDNIDFSLFDKSVLKLGDLYTSGDYEEVIDIVKKLLDDKANCFELYEYYVKSHVMMGKKISKEADSTIKNEIIEALYIAYVKDETFPISYLSVSKFARLFSNSYLGTEFACFFADKYMIGLSNILSRGKEFFSRFINVKLINALPDKKELIIKNFDKNFGKSNTVNLFNYVYSNINELDIDNIDVNRIRWYKIKKDIINEVPNTYKDLYKWYNEIREQNGIYETYQKERLSTELYYLYIENNMFLEAEELMVSATINNKYSTLRMDLDDLFSLTNIKSQEIKKSICTPIATYLYNKNDYMAIYSAVANFLDHNGINKPSDLFTMDTLFDKKHIIFFLRYICICEVIDSMYNVFEIDEEVENERIDICRYLQINDVENANVYIEEISQMLQKQKVLQGIKYLEDVKIDIDLDKVVEVHRDAFVDNYKRFKNIGNLEVEYASYDITSNTLYINNYEDGKKYNHKLLVFKEMLYDYRQELAFEKYGLDQTLGTRIRHGSLQNQIRIAFEKNNIAFVRKNTEENIYLPSKEFENYCVNMDCKSQEQLFKYISDFSGYIDGYIDNLNAEYIRIKIEDKNPKGLFDFSIKLNELVYLFQEVQRLQLQNENLVLELFENYWLEKIELGIENARVFFGNQVKQEFISKLNKLEEDISKVESINMMQYNLFDSISRSRTEVQKAIDVIIDWFKLPRKQEYSNYDAKSLVETCEMINMRVFTNYELISINKKIAVYTKFLGRTYSYIVDIMVILFTNSYYHSGYIDDVSKLEIALEIIEDNNYISITMKNNLIDSANKEDLSKTILEVQDKLNECIKKREYYNYEGKSGYIKILKILDYNLSCRSYLEFGMDEEEKNYYVTIQMPKYGIVEKG